MEVLTFNKADWSGEDITIEVSDDLKFEINDCKFQLVEKECEQSGMFYDCEGDDWDEPLFSVFQMRDGTWIAHSYDTSRENKNPVIAAAQLILFTV